MLPHIMQDYRIAAAIINCFYTRLSNDDQNDILIAKKMKLRMNTPNQLQRLISRNKVFSNSSKLKDITDSLNFPQLSLEDIVNNITFGKYNINQSKSYIHEYIDKNEKVPLKIVDHEFDLLPSKILCCKFRSKHSNSVTYTSYVHFNPVVCTYESIIGWFCECKNGARTIGCCSHIAAIIYHLAIGKYSTPNIREKISNSIQNSKKPKESDQTKQNSINSQMSESLKRELSFQTMTEISSTGKKSQTEIQTQSTQLDSAYMSSTPSLAIQFPLAVESFISHLPGWGGRIEFESSRSMPYQRHLLSNTCPIDYLLLCIWTSYKLNQRILALIEEFRVLNELLVKTLLKIINYIHENQWNMAKSIWVVDILKISPTRRTFDCFGSEYDQFIRHVKFLQEFEMHCADKNCPLFKVKEYSNDEIYVRRDDNDNIVYLEDRTCQICKKCLSLVFKRNSPPWLILQLALTKTSDFVCFDELPQTININELNYSILCTTIVSKTTLNHFSAIFQIENKSFLVDSLNSAISENIPNTHEVSVCFYYLNN